MKKTALVFLLSACLCGCGTPMVVKQLSTEQVKTQATLEQSLKNYFAIIEKLVANQVVASNYLIDQATNGIIEKRKQQALKALDTANAADRERILDELSQQTKAELETAAANKAEIKLRVEKLQTKHKELLEAYAAIRAAQEKLDAYIQLEKADEAVLNEVIGIVGINRQKAEKATDDIAVLTERLSSLLGR